MADEKKTDDTSTKKAAAKETASKDTAAAKKPSKAKVSSAQSSNEKASKAKPSTAKPVAKGSVATAKAGAIKDSDMKSAAMKINAVDKAAADNTIKSKSSSDNLKARAHEAKQRAQQKILDKAYVSDKPTDPLERLANTFDSSARRWEMVVYPSLFAFVLLAGYGFFLIYRLTHDISTLSQSVTRMAVIVSDAMPRMTKDLGSMTGSIDNMTGNIDGMTGEISSMSTQMDALTPMSNNIQSMTHNIGSMNRSVYGMQRDMHGMNRTVSSGPFGMMNDMMPFSSNTNVPPTMAAPNTWPSYNSNNPQQRNVRNRPYSPARVMPVKHAVPNAVPKENIKTEVIMPGASPVAVKKPIATVSDKAK